MSTPVVNNSKLVVRQVFGYVCDSRHPLTLCEDHQLVYVSGHQVTLLNIDTKEQCFISLGTPSVISYGVTSLVCSAIRKLIIVAEHTDKQATLSFYDSHTLKKKKYLSQSDLMSIEIVHLAVSNDGKYLLIQGGAPDWHLSLWSIEKSPKMVTYVKVTHDDHPVYQVSFCPWDPSTVVIVGKNIFKVYKLNDGQLKLQMTSIRRENFNIISYCWLHGERLILLLDSNEILLLENLELRAVIYPGANSEGVNEPVLQCVVATNRGFIASTKTSELIMFERKDESKDFYSKDSKDSIQKLPARTGNVVSMVIGSDDTFICATDHQQILTSNLLNSKAKAGSYESSMSSFSFENVLTSFHSPNVMGDATILGIDIALWRPYIVTCGKDFSVRLWNIADKKIEYLKYYDEEPVSVTIHPSGLQMLIAFYDKIKIVSILLNEFFPYQEIQARGCSYVKYSSGGQYFAVVVATSIQIYDTHTLALLTALRGHQNRIKSIQWLQHDTKIVSISVDGIIYEWNLFSISDKRPVVHTAQVSCFTGTMDKECTKAFLFTSERKLKEINYIHTNNIKTGSDEKSSDMYELSIPHTISNMMYQDSKNLLMMATADDGQPGSMLLMNTTDHITATYNTSTVHYGSISFVCMGYNNTTIITGDNYGVLVISELMDGLSEDDSADIAAEGSAMMSIHSGSINKANDNLVPNSSFAFHDEILIKKTFLTQLKFQILDLNNKINEMVMNNEYQLRLKEMEYNDKIEEITSKYKQSTLHEREKNDLLLNEKIGLENHLKKKLYDLIKKQEIELRDIEGRYKLKVDTETQRYEKLVQEMSAAEIQWNEENSKLVTSHQDYIREITHEKENKIGELQSKQHEISREKEENQANCEDHIIQIEGDAEEESDDLKAKYEQRLKLEEDASSHLKDEHSFLTKELQSLIKESEQYKEEIRKLKEKEVRLIDNIKSLEKDIQSHKKDVREREETITDKEKRIFELKKKNQELEKFRFVLDYKIKELKLQIAPREKEITTMQKQIEEMGIELEQYHRSNESLQLMIDELKLKIDGLRKEYKSQEERKELNTRLLEKVKRDLIDLSFSLEDTRGLKSKIIKYYREYILADQAQEGNGNADIRAKKFKTIPDMQELYNRDCEQMEKNLNSLKYSMKNEANTKKRNQMKMSRDNIILIKELNELQKDNKVLQLQNNLIEQMKQTPNETLESIENVQQICHFLGLKIPNLRQFSRYLENKKPSSAPTMNLETAVEAALRPDKKNTSSKSMKNTPQVRSSALATITSDNELNRINWKTFKTKKNDYYELWQIISNQRSEMTSLEMELQGLCMGLNVDYDENVLLPFQHELQHRQSLLSHQIDTSNDTLLLQQMEDTMNDALDQRYSR